MLADAGKEVAEALGILDPIEKVPLRATYLLDQERKIRWLCVNDLSVGRSTGEVLRVLAALRCGELCPANWSPGQATLVRPKVKEKAVPWETKEHVALL
jgi:lipoyl-dependent peroxiredoxin subunit C